MGGSDNMKVSPRGLNHSMISSNTDMKKMNTFKEQSIL